MCLSVIDGDDRWIGGRTRVVQVGDVFNRGDGAREAFALLGALDEAAAGAGGGVTTLLGNHEVMTALGNEAYCTTEEYLAFATARQRAAWPRRVSRAMMRLYRDHPRGGPIEPLEPRLEAWKIANVPGRRGLRRAMGPRGRVGRALRRLPVVAIAAETVFCHAPLTPAWARLGVDGLEAARVRGWETATRFYGDLPLDHMFRAEHGPLWNRDLVSRQTARTRRQIARSLELLGVRRMVVGHTQTRFVNGGEPGRIALCHDGALVCIDVGLGRLPTRAALVIEDGAGFEWTPEGTRALWS